jgi:hypothetical protein
MREGPCHNWEHQIPTWSKDSMEESSNLHGERLGIESCSWKRERERNIGWNNSRERERGTGPFIVQSYQSNWCEKPIWPVYIDWQKEIPKMDYLLSRKDLMQNEVNRFLISLRNQFQPKLKQLDLERNEGDIEEIPWRDFSKPSISYLMIQRNDSLT